jgi:hypothetical protein
MNENIQHIYDTETKPNMTFKKVILGFCILKYTK